MKRKSLKEMYRLMAHEFITPDNLMEYTKFRDLVVVLDRAPMVRDAFGTWIRVVSTAAVKAAPERFEPFQEPVLLRHALHSRGMYAAKSPQGFIKFRKIPEGASWDVKRDHIKIPGFIE